MTIISEPIRQRISAYMKEVNEECMEAGRNSKTQHNEVAPAQHELHDLRTGKYCSRSHQIMMRIHQKVASRHGMRCLHS